MKNESEIIKIVQNDEWSMVALQSVRLLGLQDWWIVAGFVGGLVWDRLHKFRERTPLGDVDVVFFDDSIDAFEDSKLEQKLHKIAPSYPWEVCNQAYMHTYNGDKFYSSSVDAFSRWAETVSTVGVTLDRWDQISIAAPCGLTDLFNMIIRSNPHTDANLDIFQNRLVEKRWQSKWPNATVIDT